MKISTSLKLLFLAVLFFTSMPLMATTLRINNNLTTDKTNRIYASLQEANDDVATKAGDTLLVDGSIKIHANFNCSKKLIIIGPGYLLTQNVGQASTVPATTQSINFLAGSEGSVIIGLTFSSYDPNYAPHVFVNSISIIRCYLTNGLYISASISNMIVIQNYFLSNGLTAIRVSDINNSFSGITLKNNIFNGDLYIVRASSYIKAIFSNVEHNIFLGNIQIESSTFRSNIIASTTSTLDIISPSIQNNITLGTQLSAYATNQSYKDNTQLFVGLTAANNKSPDGQYKLIAGNAFATAGYNNEEPGIFGGTEPYVLSGIPTIPTIYELQADAVANKQDGLNVTIKARANP